jgi:hypothetical protein
MEIRFITNENVLKHWEFFGKDMQALYDKYDDKIEDSVEIALNDILSDNAWFFAGFEDGKYFGFTILQPIYTRKKEKILLIRAVYTHREVKKSAGYIDTFINFVNEHALKVNAEMLNFHTTRNKAFERMLKNKGWQVKKVIFEKEVQDENIQ